MFLFRKLYSFLKTCFFIGLYLLNWFGVIFGFHVVLVASPNTLIKQSLSMLLNSREKKCTGSTRKRNTTRNRVDLQLANKSSKREQLYALDTFLAYF